MSERRVVMISSTARDLPEHREQVRLACERAGFAPHDMMEHLTALNTDAIDISLQMVERADVYVGIFANRYGYVPDGYEISITEMEYNRAVELNKPRLIFFNHKDHVFKTKDFESGQNAEKLKILKNRIGKARVVAFFKSPEDLRAHVVEGLTTLAKELDVAAAAEQSPDNPILKYLGSALFAAVVAFLTWLMAGSAELRTALTTLAGVVGGVCALVTSLLYARYLGVLGAGSAPARSPERMAYIKLRNSVVVGGRPAVLYAQWLTRFLDAIDRFFGDAGMADRTLFPRAFGLKTPTPLWTAPAFDRCLLLALLYPIATIFIIWAVSGHVGPAEAALQMQPNVADWKRLFAGVAVGIALFGGWRSARLMVRAKHGSRPGAHPSIRMLSISLAWIALPGGLTGAVLMTGITQGAQADVGLGLGITLAVAIVVSFVFGFINKTIVNGRHDYRPISPVFFFVTIGMLILGICFAHNYSAETGAVASGCGFALGLLWLSYKYRLAPGAFLSLVTVVLVLMFLGCAVLLSGQPSWDVAGPVLLFLGLLTLLNAPFDWVSLGLTRALLRRGLELGGWWFLVLAIVDVLLAALIIALLSLTIMIGVQAFDDLAAHGGGKPTLPLGPFFEGIAKHPTAPEYWWLYALLFSTMIPSIVNLMIGGASLMRGVPGVSPLLLKFMPANKAVPAFDRAWIATVLTLQLVGGAILGIVVQGGLLYAVFGYVMPWLGLELLDMARAVAAFDLPGRIIAWL